MKSNKKQLYFTLSAGTTADTDFPFTVNVDTDAPPKSNFYPADAISFSIQNDENGVCWQRDGYLSIDFESDAASTFLIFFAFFRGEEQLSEVNVRTVGGRRVKTGIALRYLDSSTAFPPMLGGRLKCMTGGKPTSIDEIDRVTIRIKSAKAFTHMTLYDLSVSETLPEYGIMGEPMVDRYGQNLEHEWEGKIHSDDELCRYLRNEYTLAQAQQDYGRDDYDEYGGWKKMKFEARGHFYVHHDGSRFWLVDPLGHAFFSNGFCYGSRTGIYGLVDSMLPLFSELPDQNDPLFREAWTTAVTIPEYVKRNGLENASGVRLFNFARANMIRVFGKDWFNAWVTINTARMKRWGFNTIAVGVNNYNDEHTEEFLKKAKMPYCITLKEFPKTDTLIFRDLPDIFSDQYRTLCDTYAAQLQPFSDDPYFIGYFMTNEPEWWFAARRVNVAERVFALDKPTATRTVLIESLRKKYGDVATLNRAWGTEFENFDDLERPLPYLNEKSEAAEADFAELKTMILRQYCAVPSESIRKIAPHALNMGMRYGGVHAGGDGLAATECFDVFSVNCYGADPSEKFDAASSLDKPFVSGEWHFGTLDRGMLSNGAVGCVTQADRGVAAANYLLTALENPCCVGVHYFEFNDQPLLGRFDGENQQIGMIDVCNRPYDECVEKFAAINRDMYPILCRHLTPQKQPWAQELKY